MTQRETLPDVSLSGMKVELRIEELILEGFPLRGSERFGRALKRELARLFTEGGVPPSLVRGGEIVRLDGGAFNAIRGIKPDTVGAQIAQSVYQGLKQ